MLRISHRLPAAKGPLIAFLILFALFPCAVAVGQTAAAAYQAENLNICPGSDASQLNFAWLSASSQEKPEVEIAPRSGDSLVFSASEAQSFTGTSSQVFATVGRKAGEKTAEALYSDKVVISGLLPSHAYLYRVGDGKVWSEPQPLQTEDNASFGFLVVGDPQLGAKAFGAKTLEWDEAGWKDTVAKARSLYPASAFMISLGDQVNDYNKLSVQDSEYAAYFSPAQLLSLPVAVIDGNHDIAMGEYYGYHYNLPNLSPSYGTSYGNDGDYWFVHGNAIFLMLNSNTQSVATHEAFIAEALARNPSATWRIVCFHHSIYSEASNSNDPDILDRRSNYPPVFERYKIDLVLQGHNHSYTRSYPLLKGQPVDVQEGGGTVKNPRGIVYFTFNSGSGNKFNDWREENPEVFSAKRWQGHVASFAYLALDQDSITIKVYRTDSMDLLDQYRMEKTAVSK